MLLSDRTTHQLPLLPITTAVVWLLCVAVGALGGYLKYPQPRPPENVPPPVQAQVVNVDVIKDPPPPEVHPLQPVLAPQPTQPNVAPLPAAPPLTAVAAPSPVISFALPVEGLTQLVDANHAAFSRPVSPVTTAGPSGTGTPGPGVGAASSVAQAQPLITHLTLGEGDGNQPVPEYPPQAAADGEQGTVMIQFNVDTAGHVTDARIVSACHWPLLNQSALRTVRERWRFSAGPPRIFEVPIQFQLNQ